MAAAVLGVCPAAQAATTIGPIFYIPLENHNFTQPGTYTTTKALYGNAAAPFINSLVTAGDPNAKYVSYASNYHNIITGGSELHPSEPNYIWGEAGTNFTVNSDSNPYNSDGSRLNSQASTQHLTGMLQRAGISWKSYQEDTGLLNDAGQPFNSSGGTLTNNVAASDQLTVPLTNFSGTSSSYTNPYNGSHQYDYEPKHNSPVFFDDTNGGSNRATSNTEASHYAAMQTLQTDLTNKTVASYNWITPDIYNDMHTSLANGFTYKGTAYTGDSANIAQGDNFLSLVVPMIMASDAFQNQNGTIVIWNDETEGETPSTRASFSGLEIVISKLAKGNAYNGTLSYDHSSDLKTMQELFGLGGATATGFLGAASTATDLSDLFLSGALPHAGAIVIPEPAGVALIAAGGWALLRRRRRSA